MKIDDKNMMHFFQTQKKYLKAVDGKSFTDSGEGYRAVKETKMDGRIDDSEWEYFFSSAGLNGLDSDKFNDTQDYVDVYLSNNPQAIDRFFLNSVEYGRYLQKVINASSFLKSIISKNKDIFFDFTRPVDFVLKALNDQRLFPIRNNVFSWAAHLIMTRDISESQKKTLVDILFKNYKVEEEQSSTQILYEFNNIVQSGNVSKNIKINIFRKIQKMPSVKFSCQIRPRNKLMAAIVTSKYTQFDNDKILKDLLNNYLGSSGDYEYEDSLVYLANKLTDQKQLSELSNALQSKIINNLDEPQPLSFVTLSYIFDNKYTSNDERRKIISFLKNKLVESSKVSEFPRARYHMKKWAVLGLSKIVRSDVKIEKFNYKEDALIAIEDCRKLIVLGPDKHNGYAEKLETDILANYTNMITKGVFTQNEIKQKIKLIFERFSAMVIDDKAIEEIGLDINESRLFVFQKLLKYSQEDKELNQKICKYVSGAIKVYDASYAIQLRTILKMLPNAYCRDYFSYLKENVKNEGSKLLTFLMDLMSPQELDWYQNVFLKDALVDDAIELNVKQINFLLKSKKIKQEIKDTVLIQHINKIRENSDLEILIQENKSYFQKHESKLFDKNKLDAFTFKYLLLLKKDNKQMINNYLGLLLKERKYRLIFGNIEQLDIYNRKVLLDLLKNFSEYVYKMNYDNDDDKRYEAKYIISEVIDYIQKEPLLLKHFIEITKDKEPDSLNIEYLQFKRSMYNLIAPTIGDKYLFGQLKKFVSQEINDDNVAKLIEFYQMMRRADIGNNDSNKIYKLFSGFYGTKIIRFLKDKDIDTKKWEQFIIKSGKLSGDGKYNLDFKKLMFNFEQDGLYSENPGNASKFINYIRQGRWEYAFSRLGQKLWSVLFDWIDFDFSNITLKENHEYQLQKGYQILDLFDDGKEKMGTMFLASADKKNKLELMIDPGSPIERTLPELQYKNMVIQTTGTYTSADNKPTDFVIKKGEMLSYYVSERDGIIILDEAGKARTLNLQELTVTDLISAASKNKRLDIFKNIDDFYQFLEIAKEQKMTILQGHLLYYAGKSQLHTNANRATTNRRVFITYKDGRNGVINFYKALSFPELVKIAEKLKIYSMFNLDTGSYDFLAVYDKQRKSHSYGDGADNSTTKIIFYQEDDVK